MSSDHCENPVLFQSRPLKQNVKFNIWKFNDGNGVPCRENFILFYSISSYTLHTCCQHFKGRIGTSPSQKSRKARSPITHIATANQLKLPKTVAR